MVTAPILNNFGWGQISKYFRSLKTLKEKNDWPAMNNLTYDNCSQMADVARMNIGFETLCPQKTNTLKTIVIIRCY